MERTVSVKLLDRIGCCVGDTVYMTVKTVSKLVSYGSACETSEVPGMIIGTGLNSDGTFTYVVKYSSTVLNNQCNYLLPTDVAGLCCSDCCDTPKCACNDPCLPPPPPCKPDKCVCGNCLPKQEIKCDHTRNNCYTEEGDCVTIIKGVKYGCNC